MEIVTNYDTTIDETTYYVRIYFHDEEKEYYTADWWSESNREREKLGYGLGQCHDVEIQVERTIRERSKAEGIKLSN